jgi:exopolyphosphatase/guanosine-5'-triphosphate,3'-diphosphate pyrophosphatase
MKKIAIIDMGTNTFHLLIAGKGPSGHVIVHRDYEAVKLGKGGINEDIIANDACERALHAMIRFNDAIREHLVSDVYAFGTSAMRNAKNGFTLANEILTATGIHVRIISGDEEADLIFEGVRAALKPGDETSLIMDIGAGSVEFIIGNKNGLRWKQSFEIGGQRLLEKFHKTDPIAPEEVKALDAFFEEKLRPLSEALEKFNPTVLAGSSGTFDTLSDIFSIRHHIPRTADEAETALMHEGFYEIYDELIHKNRKERMDIPGMIEMRIDMIVVSCCLIRFII